MPAVAAAVTRIRTASVADRRSPRLVASAPLLDAAVRLLVALVRPLVARGRLLAALARRPGARVRLAHGLVLGLLARRRAGPGLGDRVLLVGGLVRPGAGPLSLRPLVAAGRRRVRARGAGARRVGRARRVAPASRVSRVRADRARAAVRAVDRAPRRRVASTARRRASPLGPHGVRTGGPRARVGTGRAVGRGPTSLVPALRPVGAGTVAGGRPLSVRSARQRLEPAVEAPGRLPPVEAPVGRGARHVGRQQHPGGPGRAGRYKAGVRHRGVRPLSAAVSVGRGAGQVVGRATSARRWVRASSVPAGTTLRCSRTMSCRRTSTGAHGRGYGPCRRRMRTPLHATW